MVKVNFDKWMNLRESSEFGIGDNLEEQVMKFINIINIINEEIASGRENPKRLLSLFSEFSQRFMKVMGIRN